MLELNRGLSGFRSPRNSVTAGRGAGPSRRSPRRVAPTSDSVARRDEVPPVSARVPVSGRVSQGRGHAPAASIGSQAPAGRTGRSAPGGRSGIAESTARAVQGSSAAVAGRGVASVGVAVAGRGVASAGIAGKIASGRGSSRPIVTGLPPLAAPPARPSTTTTSRTGLTEVQLKEISSTIKRSNAPSFSETVNKRRRLDVAIERNSEFLSRQDKDASGSGGSDSLMNMLMMQNAQRDARTEEYRQQEIIRAERRQDEVERREELERARQEQRREDQLDREDSRRRDDMEREERREKSENARSQMMFMFMNHKRNEDK